MASLVKAGKANAERKKLSEGKRKLEAEEDDEMEVDEAETPAPPKKKRNKQRVLMLSSRGVTHRMRHLMNDLEALFPQIKKGVF
jgi:ribosome biogenesis protein BRX1